MPNWVNFGWQQFSKQLMLLHENYMLQQSQFVTKHGIIRSRCNVWLVTKFGFKITSEIYFCQKQSATSFVKLDILFLSDYYTWNYSFYFSSINPFILRALIPLL